MRKLSLFLLFLICISLHAQDYTEGSPFKVRLHSDFRSFSDEDHVYIDASVTNISDKTEKFYRFDIEYTTFQPIVFDNSGREAETTVSYRIDNNTADQMVRGSSPRVIKLAPQETFTVRLNLADYYDINPGTNYRVRLLFLPDASRKEPVAAANIYRFTVDPRTSSAAGTSAIPEADMETGIQPHEVMRLFFTAEKNESWNNYLKYIKEEEYIYSFPEYASQYVGAGGPAKKQVLENFKTFLISYRPDALIDFEILDETITDERATVQVRARRQAARQPFVYVYTFSLEKYSAYWKITGVEASLSRDTRQ